MHRRVYLPVYNVNLLLRHLLLGLHLGYSLVLVQHEYRYLLSSARLVRQSYERKTRYPKK